MNTLTSNTETKRRMLSFFIALLLVLPLCFMQSAFAATGSYTSWLSPFSSFMDSMLDFIQLIGKGLLAWAVFEIATSLFSHDTSQMPQALRRIGGGALLVFTPALLDAMTTSASMPSV